MRTETETFIKSMFPDMMEAARIQLRAGTPPHEIIVVVFDSGTRVGTDAMPFVVALSRRVLRELAAPGATYVEVDDGRLTTTPVEGRLSEATLMGRVLRFLRDEVGDVLKAEVRQGRFMYVAKFGDDLSIGTAGSKPN